MLESRTPLMARPPPGFGRSRQAGAPDYTWLNRLVDAPVARALDERIVDGLADVEALDLVVLLAQLDDGVLELGGIEPTQSPEPPAGLEARSLPFHRECLDKRLAD